MQSMYLWQLQLHPHGWGISERHVSDRSVLLCYDDVRLVVTRRQVHESWVNGAGRDTGNKLRRGKHTVQNHVLLLPWSPIW
jgi:hypothetical protein